MRTFMEVMHFRYSIINYQRSHWAKVLKVFLCLSVLFYQVLFLQKNKKKILQLCSSIYKPCIINRLNLKWLTIPFNSLLRYEIQPKPDEPKCKQFLENISKYDELLIHESTKHILAEKWNEQAKFLYWSKLILYLVFIISYTLHIEVYNKPDLASNDLRQAVKYISLALSCLFLAMELIRLLMKIVKRHFINYMFSQHWVETFTYSLIIVCLVIEYGEVQSSLLSVTVLLAYVIFLMKLDKVETIGAFVTAFYSIITGSFTLLFVVFILLMAFLLSFRNRAQAIASNDVQVKLIKINFLAIKSIC